MGKVLLFDTLKYANILRKNSIDGADHLSTALAEALSENLYSKSEVEKMIEQALKRFDDRTLDMKEEFRQMREDDQEKTRKLIEEMRQQREADQEYYRKSREELLKEMHAIQSKLATHVNRMTGLILAVFAIASSVSHFFH